MERRSSSCVPTTVAFNKVCPSSSLPVRVTSIGEGDRFSSGAPAPCCREQRRGRGRRHQMPRDRATGACDGNQLSAGVCERITGPQLASTTSSTLLVTYGAHREDDAQAGHPCSRGYIGRWREGDVCSVNGACGFLRNAPLQTSLVAPFPTVFFPTWCRFESVPAYPLSENGLTRELVDFFHHLELNTHEMAARARLLDCVRACVTEVWGPRGTEGEPGTTAQVMLYGSYGLGLSLPSSDIDLALVFPAEEEEEEGNATGFSRSRGGGSSPPTLPTPADTHQALCLERLHNLAEQLRKSARVSPLKVEVYDQCRVPRIHLQDMSCGGVSCDTTSSFISTRVARIVARQKLWLEDSPLAAFLVRITKAAVRQWGLNEVFCGGVASTALYCLVLRFLAQVEQLHQHAGVEGECLPPPRYEETTAANPFAVPDSPLRCASSSSSLPQLSFPHSTGEHPATPPPAASVPAAIARGGSTLSAAASAPLYVPSWAASNKKLDQSMSSSLRAMDQKEDALRLVNETACTLSHSGATSSACDEDREADNEVDGYTQAGLTHSSGATTATTTPTSRTAASTPSLTGGEAHNKGAPSAPAALAPSICGVPAVQNDGRFPAVEELSRIAQTRYGASPARLLLKLWRFLSADAFLGGYQVADVFGNDMVWNDCGDRSESAAPPTRLPSMASLERATFAGTASADLSAASFRTPELQALFRASCTSLENMLHSQRYPWCTAPTMLSTIFVDPRLRSTL